MCKNFQGQEVKTSIDLNQCVTNNNGNLGKGTGFAHSSSSCYVNGNILTCAKVKNGNGQTAESSTDLNSLVGNNNGNLQC